MLKMPVSVAVRQSILSDLHQRAAKAAILAFGGLRIFTSLWMAALSVWVPLNRAQELTWDPLSSQFVLGVQPLSRMFLLPWYRWDTLHYLQIAQFGYSADVQNTVWPPLYPMLIRTFELFIPDAMLATLLVSSLAALLAFYLLYLLVAQIWDERLAGKVLLFVAIFPTAFYFVAGYSESVFLSMAIASLLALKQRRWIWSGIFAGLASLTRVQGVLLVFPFAWEVFRWLKEARSFQIRRWLPILAGLGLIPLAYVGYAIYVHYGLGSSWPLQSLENGWSLHFDWPWLGIWTSFVKLITPVAGSDIYVGNILIDLVMSLLAITLLVIGWRRLPGTYQLYAWPLLISATSKVTELNLLVSMPRYVVTIFPIFIILALKIQKKALMLVWFGVSVAAQMFLLSLFYLRVFVG